jgi:hypothetical protein
MTKDELSFVAEALLALCERRPEAPFYSEEHLARKLKEAEWREPLSARIELPDDGNELTQAECREVLRLARLTYNQWSVMSMRLDGMTFEDIGRRRGCTKQTAMNVFVIALKKLTRSHTVYPYVGLGEVYREEVRRGLKPGRFGTMR